MQIGKMIDTSQNRSSRARNIEEAKKPVKWDVEHAVSKVLLCEAKPISRSKPTMYGLSERGERLQYGYIFMRRCM